MPLHRPTTNWNLFSPIPQKCAEASASCNGAIAAKKAEQAGVVRGDTQLFPRTSQPRYGARPFADVCSLHFCTEPPQLAYASSCARDQFDRPVAGMLNVCLAVINSQIMREVVQKWADGVFQSRSNGRTQFELGSEQVLPTSCQAPERRCLPSSGRSSTSSCTRSATPSVRTQPRAARPSPCALRSCRPAYRPECVS